MLVRITPPTVPVVTLSQAKEALRLDGDDENALVESLIAAAVGSLDGPDGTLGRALAPQTLDLRLQGFGCGSIRLPLPPCASVVSIKVTGTDGAEATVDPTIYRVLNAGTGLVASIELAHGKSWPSIRAGSDAVRIRYEAGYAEGAVPGPIARAVLIRVAHLYENRGGSNQGGEPPAVEALLTPFRVTV